MNEMSAGKASPTASQDNPARRAVRANRDYAEFLPAALEISVRPVPHVVPVLIGLIVSALGVALIWSWVSYLDVFTNAAGRVRAVIPPAVVQPAEPGRVVRLHVANGDRVAAGDVLVTLDDVAVRTALDAAVAGRASWLAEVERRAAAYRSLITGSRALPTVSYSLEIPSVVVRRESEALATEHQALLATLLANEASREEAIAKRARFLEVKAARSKLVDILTERVGMTEALSSSSAGSRALVLTATEARVRAEVDLADIAAQLAEVEASLKNLREQEAQAIANYLANQSKGIQAAERQVEQLDQEIVKQRDRLGHLVLRAPIDGIVQQVAVTSNGQVVTPAQTLMVVVPNGMELMIEALVPSSEIGFVSVGDPAVVKADAFPYTRYGTFTGNVIAVSPEAVTARDAQALQEPAMVASGQAVTGPSGIPSVAGLYYIVRISINEGTLNNGRRLLTLEPGMTVRVEIKTESRRVIDYLLSPIEQTWGEAGHER